MEDKGYFIKVFFFKFLNLLREYLREEKREKEKESKGKGKKMCEIFKF